MMSLDYIAWLWELLSFAIWRSSQGEKTLLVFFATVSKGIIIHEQSLWRYYGYIKILNADCYDFTPSSDAVEKAGIFKGF